MELEKDRLLSVWPETGEYLGTSRAHTYALVSSGVIPSVRFGRSLRVPMKALLAFVERNTTGGSEQVQR